MFTRNLTNFRKHTLITTLAAAGLCGLTTSTHALTLGAGGLVSDWGIKPFDASLQPVDTTSVRQNNTSPINYGGSIGLRPSGGEAYDLEELHIRNIGSSFQVLLVTSSLWKIDNSILLGDLLMNTDGLPGFDMGLVTQTASKGLPAGQVYDNVSTAGLQINSNTYAGNFNIESQINNTPGQLAAMFVSGGDPTGPVGSINTTSYNYGTINQNGLNKNENNSYLYEFTFELSPTFTTVDFQIGWGCGNDVIRASHTVTHPAVPEPATMATGMLALTGLVLGVTRRRA